LKVQVSVIVLMGKCGISTGQPLNRFLLLM
jgi:hypothetical protein